MSDGTEIAVSRSRRKAIAAAVAQRAGTSSGQVKL
jgi:hypothetical protein